MNQATEKVYVVDPYFTDKDLDLVDIIRSQLPKAVIYVMTGLKKIEEVYGNTGVSDAFRKAWKAILPAKAPGDIKVFVVGKSGTKDSPIHDRFILLDKIGIKIGGSWNGVGGDKQMDLFRLGEAETLNWRAEAEKYVLYMQSHEAGVQISYDMFSI